MRTSIFNAIIISLFLLSVLCGFGFLNTMVAHKYEVSHARSILKIEDSESEDEKENRSQDIDELEESIERQQNGALITGIAAFIIATVMLINRNKIVKRSKIK